MTWNYRVIHRVVKEGRHAVDYFGIHEVYYHDDGNIRMWTDNPVCPSGETLDEFRQDVVLYTAAFDKPVLELSDLEKLIAWKTPEKITIECDLTEEGQRIMSDIVDTLTKEATQEITLPRPNGRPPYVIHVPFGSLKQSVMDPQNINVNFTITLTDEQWAEYLEMPLGEFLKAKKGGLNVV